MSFLRSYIKLDIKNFENNSDEVLGILAHELGHVAYKDTLVQNIETSILVLQLPIFIQIVHLSEFFMGSVGLIGFDIPVEVGIPLAEVFSHFFIQYLKPLFLLYSRYSEYRADRHAVKLGYGQELYDALAKKSEKCDIFATPLYKFMSCTHPPIIERLVHLKECLSKSHST
jgi:Zn-dependent protease with chaperone function